MSLRKALITIGVDKLAWESVTSPIHQNCLSFVDIYALRRFKKMAGQRFAPMKDYGHQCSPSTADDNLGNELFILPEVRNLETMDGVYLALAVDIVSRVGKFCQRINVG